MNERIKELMKEANKDITLGKPFWPALEEFSEKFAEALVKECGVALSPMLRDQISRGRAYDLIKQHFGVAE
jgi:hypothetical protein